MQWHWDSQGRLLSIFLHYYMTSLPDNVLIFIKRLQKPLKFEVRYLVDPQKVIFQEMAIFLEMDIAFVQLNRL